MLRGLQALQTHVFAPVTETYVQSSAIAGTVGRFWSQSMYDYKSFRLHIPVSPKCLLATSTGSRHLHSSRYIPFHFRRALCSCLLCLLAECGPSVIVSLSPVCLLRRETLSFLLPLYLQMRPVTLATLVISSQRPCSLYPVVFET